jgi:sporulation protein YlmC with PRC-barrel domain
MNRWNMTTLTDVRGKDIVATDGEKIGSVRDIFYDDKSGQPEWVSVGTGFLGMKERLVPADSLEPAGEHLKVPFTKDKVQNEPDFDLENGVLKTQDETRLYSYFSITGQPRRSTRVLRYGEDYRGTHL